MQKFNQFPPFEVSQNWFSGAELTLVTVLLAFSPVLGTMVAQAATPSLVPTADDIPTMHWVWSILSTVAMVMFIAFVRTSVPPTPPSRSADMASQRKLSYLNR